jgi:hypothetical protein
VNDNLKYGRVHKKVNLNLKIYNTCYATPAKNFNKKRMLIIRYKIKKRIGIKNPPSYHIILTNHTRSPQSGKVITKLGFYTPQNNLIILNISLFIH